MSSRRVSHLQKQARASRNEREFNYDLDYHKLNLRTRPELYRVGISEQGVLLVEPYKSEILRYWKFKNPADARLSSRAIYQLFLKYLKNEDFIGMDMARKFLQMGFTRASRYANHSSGQKYNADGTLLPFANDFEKAKSAQVFYQIWKKAEAHPTYADMKLIWRAAYG